MAPTPALAQASGLRLTLGGAALFEDAGFVLHKGDRAALVGANGAGKSTLLRIVAGLIEPDAGSISLASGCTVAFVPQDPDFGHAQTLLDYVCGGGAPRHEAEAALDAFALDPARGVGDLSGGEARRAALARALARNANLLLLDEPTNHLDIAAIEDLENLISAHRGASLIVSHDRRFLERVTNATLWLRRRRLFKLDRGFAHFEDWAANVEKEEERELARLRHDLDSEEYWLRRGVTARRSRNEGRRRKLEALRAEMRRRRELAASQTAALQAERGEASGRLVIDAKDISKSYAGAPVIQNLSLRVFRGDRLGVVGPNGAGKTTLIELLLKRREPDSGSVRHGERLTIAYVDQKRSLLNPGDTVWQALAPLGGDQVVVNGKPRHVAAYAADFLFTSAQLRQPVSALSGGERNRLALAVALTKPANLLVLDEPTNDLDMETLDALEEMLDAYDGAVILVSHDRAFLDGVATELVGPIGRGRWVESPGGWSDFEREHGRPSRNASEKPKPPPSAPPPAPRAATKLSYKEERRAAELETMLTTLAAEIETLESQLHDPGLFARDAATFNAVAAQLEAARARRHAAESEWLEIELKREQLSSKA